MVEINLLPWREAALRYQQSITRKIFAFVIALSATIISVLYWEIARREGIIKEDIISLQKEMKDNEAASSIHLQPLSTQALFEELGNEKKRTRYLLAALKDAARLKGCLTQIKRTKNKITFYGRAPSSFDLTTFLTHWNSAAFFSEIQIERIDAQKEGGIDFRFSLPFRVSAA